MENKQTITRELIKLETNKYFFSISSAPFKGTSKYLNRYAAYDIPEYKRFSFYCFLFNKIYVASLSVKHQPTWDLNYNIKPIIEKIVGILNEKKIEHTVLFNKITYKASDYDKLNLLDNDYLKYLEKNNKIIKFGSASSSINELDYYTSIYALS